MNQIYGQHITPGESSGRWKPIAAVEQPDGSWALKVDTELVLDSANINLSNMKVGSVDQTSNTLRFLRIMDDGTLITESTPLDSYEVSDVDDGNDPSGSNYYAYLTMDEDWYIMEENLSGVTATYRYFKGSGSYVAAWNSRASHSYDYFHNIF